MPDAGHNDEPAVRHCWAEALEGVGDTIPRAE